MDRRALYPWWFWLSMAVLFGAAGWWVKIQWHECRELGFGVLYCIQHVA